MKKKIIILGSTGSIGNNTIDIIQKDKKNFKIELLTANKNYKDLISQAKKFQVKNIVITDPQSFKKTKQIIRNKKLNVFQNFNDLKKILPKKIDYVMSAISGISGLLPTLKIINRTKLIAIVNKEAIVCGWPIINKELKKNRTKFIPVDSEHFSIFSLLDNKNINKIEKIYITASGGPFINLPKSQFGKIKLSDALKHPNWSIGKKITIDSATLMNKVFEVIEAKNIFNLSYKKISIFTHPNSYVHAIVKFKNGIIKILVHEPDMNIPIQNSIYTEVNNIVKSKKLNLKILNDLSLKEVNFNQFPFAKILHNLPNKNSLYETILVTINDHFVHMFLKNKINYNKLIYLILKYVNLKEFVKYKRIKPRKLNDIYKLRNYVSLKLSQLSI